MTGKTKAALGLVLVAAIVRAGTWVPKSGPEALAAREARRAG